MKKTGRETEDYSRYVTRRGLVLGAAQLAFIGVLGTRMRSMQVDQADEYRMLAEENRINMRLLPPPRGLILDRNGVPIAVNAQNYRVVIVREDAEDIAGTLQKLRRLIPLGDEEIERAEREMSRRSSFVPVTVADQLTWDDLARVAVNAPALPGVHPEVGLSRSYPLGADFAHIVGYVGPVSDYDLAKLEDRDPLLQIPKFQIGKSGVEAKMEHELRGKAGSSRIEVNAVGRVMRELSRTEGTPGHNLQLTIDEGLQNYVQARLGAESAAAVVTDAQTGDLMAIGSAPSFDPNKFVTGISSKDYSELIANDHRPLANKAVQGTYPPGSTFKMITALAALESGAITPQTTEYCPGYVTLGGRRFHCWSRGGHGHLDLVGGLKNSCDVYFYEISQRVGIDRISEMAKRLGVGISFDLPMSAVAEGLAPNRDWKRANRDAAWVPGDTLNASIGQGFVLASPLQLSIMTARIASGRNLQPRLIRAVDGVEQVPVGGEPLGIAPEHLNAVRRGMHAVMNDRRGTAYRSRIENPAMVMAGKTGTSQVRNITAAERRRGVTGNDDLPWNRRDHALFVCYAPYEAPRYAVSLIVEHGGGGSAVAAPIARDILLRALYGEVPPLAAYPAGERGKVEELHKLLKLRNLTAASKAKSRA